MACPHVSGVAALVFATGKTAAEVRSILSSTAEDIGLNSNDQGSGLVDAELAAAGPVEPITDIAITDISAPSSVKEGDLVGVSVTVKNVGNQEVSAFTVDLYDGAEVLWSWTVSGLTVGSTELLEYLWDTTGETIGDHSLTALSEFTDDDSTNNQKSTVIAITDPDELGATMHIGDLTGYRELKGRSGRWEAFVTVTIHDENHQLVSGATVSGAWTGDASGTVSGTTGSDGTVTFSTGNISGGTAVTFEVTGVTHSTLTYDPDSNEISASKTVNK
jgi:subtilisin